MQGNIARPLLTPGGSLWTRGMGVATVVARMGSRTIATVTRDAQRTRNELLRAAQTLFAERGYTTTGVREVAGAAGVNTTLIRRYFGSKEGLLRAAVEDLLQIAPFIDGPRTEFGRRAIATLLHGDRPPNPMAMMVLATADPAARVMCGDLMHERIVVPLANWLGGAEPMRRAAKLNMLWIGFMTARHILPVASLEDRSGSTHEWLAELFQAIADGASPAGLVGDAAPGRTAD